MVDDVPVLVDDREKLINQLWDVLEVRGGVAPDVDRLFSEAATKLRNNRDGRCV